MTFSPYTIPQLLAGSIELLLRRHGAGEQDHSKLIYIIYGYADTTYKACWDQLRRAFGEEIFLVSIDQLPETSLDEYPSGRHRVIYYRNAPRLPVLCFDNRGNFEGYGTSLGKVERIGNQVTGEVATCLLQWIIQEGLIAEDPQKRSLANYLHNKDHKDYLRVFQLLFDTVKPHMERVVHYFNALCNTPEITNKSWGEYLHILGLFRDTSLFESFPVSNRAIIDNHTLSQVGYWERETREHIRTAHLDANVQTTLLGVMADATRLPEARQTLELRDFRTSLLTRPRRSAEKIAQMLIYKDLQRAYISHELDIEIGKGTPTETEEDLHEFAQSIFEFYRNGTEPTLFPATSGVDSQLTEPMQRALELMSQKTVAAIKKVLAQQPPLLYPNLFLGILKCLLLWKEEQENEEQEQNDVFNSSQDKSLSNSTGPRIEKVSVMDIALFPHPTIDKWKALLTKVDQRIRERWDELIHNTALATGTSSRAFVGHESLLSRPSVSLSKGKKQKTAPKKGGRQQASWEDTDKEIREEEPVEDLLSEQMNDVEENNIDILDISVRMEGSSGRDQQSSAVVYTFQLEYDPVETLMLKCLMRSASSIVDDEALGNLAWEFVSGASMSTDLRSIGLAMMKAPASLKGTVPPSVHRHLPGVQELALAFEELTKSIREQEIGLGYFSTLLLPGISSFLDAYVSLLIQAKNTEQDAFDSTYGKWISQLFTVDLQHAKQTHFTHLVTPFHPLQLRWRQTYERELIRHIEDACQRPALLNEKFFDELANLSAYNVPGILALRRDQQGKPPLRTVGAGRSPAEDVTKHEPLSYPSAISRNTLFSAYSPVLQGLQGLPSQLIRKIEQFFLIYPSAVDRAQISVICPIDIDIENALSRIFEKLQQRYMNAGFFVRLFLPDTIEQVSPLSSRWPRRRYDEDQGELRVRTRHHLFPRTEFVTLRQDLLKTAKGQRFLFGEAPGPTQHLFLLLDHLGVEIQPHEIPPEARGHLDEYIVSQEKQEFISTLAATSPEEVRGAAAEKERRPDPLTILFHQGQEMFDEDHHLWTRGLVDSRDTMSLLYYTIAARSQGHAGKIYRYVCNLSRSTAEELRIDTLVKTLHNFGIWVAIVDRAITREFFRTAQTEDENTLMLIDFHKGIGPQRGYNVTISSIWTQRVRENVQIALEQIAQATRPGDHTFEHPLIASAIMRQLQDISGGLALQLAASNANTKGLLGLLVTALEAAEQMKEVSTIEELNALQRKNTSIVTYRAVIPLDDHNDWFERDEIRTDLLVVTFEVDTNTTNIEDVHALHVHFSLIECKFDESVLRASKGFEQLQETAKRLSQLFDHKALDYPFRLRDLTEAIRGLAKMYRGGLPDSYLERLRTNDKYIHVHVDKDEIAYYLCLYQTGDHLSEVQVACSRHDYRLLSNTRDPFEGMMRHHPGERVCYYQYEHGLGDTFERLVRWLSEEYRNT